MSHAVRQKTLDSTVVSWPSPVSRLSCPDDTVIVHRCHLSCGLTGNSPEHETSTPTVSENNHIMFKQHINFVHIVSVRVALLQC